MISYDVIVIGAGVIGSSTAYYLSKEGYKTLLLEQFPLPHSRGSSYGHSRLGKISHKHRFISELLPTNLELWKKLEKESGISFIVTTGHLSVAESNLNKQILEPLQKHLSQRNITYKSYQGGDIGREFPGMSFDKNFDAFFEPNGIILKADKCLLALRSEIVKHNGEIHDEEKVANIIPINDKKVEVHTNKAIYTANSTVLTCGPWNNKLLKNLGIKLPIEAVRVMAYYWKEKIPGMYSAYNNFPPLMIYFSEYHLYSTPSIEFPGLIKICYHCRIPVDADQPDIIQPEHQIKEKDRLEFIKSLIAKHFPFLEPHPVLEERYLQTITPNSAPILDRLPFHKNIIVGAGFSGAGFTPALVYGQILGNLAIFSNEEHRQKIFSLKSSL